MANERVMVYVAGASAELERAERVIAALRERGVEVTHDWSADIRAARAAGYATDAALPRAEQREIADDDLYGVERAGVVLLLWPVAAPASFGSGVEWGFALLHHARTDARLALVAPVESPHVFTSYAHVVLASDEDAVAWIAGLGS